MPLEDLLAKVKDKRRQREIEMKKEHQERLDEIKERKKKEYEDLKSDLDNCYSEKRQELFSKKLRTEEFDLQMERLELKKELLEEAKEKTLEDLEDLSEKEKAEIYLKRIKKEKDLLKDASKISVPKGKKKELEPILKEAGIEKSPEEKDLEFKEGFLFSGDRWSVSITLDDILNSKVKKERKELVNLLFTE